jgi:hypothetical protein
MHFSIKAPENAFIEINDLGHVDSVTTDVQLLDENIAEFRCRHRLLRSDQFTIDDDVAVPIRNRIDVCAGLGQRIYRIELHIAAKTIGQSMT